MPKNVINIQKLKRRNFKNFTLEMDVIHYLWVTRISKDNGMITRFTLEIYV